MLLQKSIRVLSPWPCHAYLWQTSILQNWRLYTSVTAGGGSVSYLRSAKTGVEIYLVGTAHVSSKSADEVLQVIDQVKPDTVAVELCAERAKKLMAGEHITTPSFLGAFSHFIKTPGGLGQKIVSFAFKSLYAMLRNTGMEPGKEFKVACEEAERRGANLLCIDQDSTVTVQRIVDVMSYRDVFNLFTNQSGLSPEMHEKFKSTNFEDAVESLKTRENVRATMKTMETIFPKLVQVMIHERDKVMFDQLRQCNGKVVGVVGMAHMDGIERLWKDMEN